jgi:hypothetical protein
MVETIEVGNRDPDLAHLLVDYWKLARGAAKAVGKLPEGDAKRLASQVRYASRQLDLASSKFGLRVVEFEGSTFEVGMAASADNIDDFNSEAALVVDRTIEPAVVKGMRVVRAGRVLVKEIPGEGE